MLTHMLRTAGTKGPSLEYITSNYIGGSSQTVFNFNGISIGTPSADRTLLIVLYSQYVLDTTATSTLTIDGVSATKTISVTDNYARTTMLMVEIYAITVASGTTANIQATFSSSRIFCGLSVYAATGLVSNTPQSTASSILTTSPQSVAVTGTTGGVVIAGTMMRADDGAVSWSQVTEFNEDIRSISVYRIVSSSGAILKSTAGTVNVAVTSSSTSTLALVSVAAYFG